jgi:hypothetical protein
VNAVLTAAVGPLFNGGAVAELEIIGPDGRQLTSVVSASTGGILELVGFYLKGRHAENALKRAARDLRAAAAGEASPAAPMAPEPARP